MPCCEFHTQLRAAVETVLRGNALRRHWSTPTIRCVLGARPDRRGGVRQNGCRDRRYDGDAHGYHAAASGRHRRGPGCLRPTQPDSYSIGRRWRREGRLRWRRRRVCSKGGAAVPASADILTTGLAEGVGRQCGGHSTRWTDSIDEKRETWRFRLSTGPGRPACARSSREARGSTGGHAGARRADQANVAAHGRHRHYRIAPWARPPGCDVMDAGAGCPTPSPSLKRP